MSYEKAMKHVRSHRKDRYFQQCATPSPTDKTLSGAMISELYATSFHVEINDEKVSPDFPDQDDAIDFFLDLPIEKQRQAKVVDDIGITIYR